MTIKSTLTEATREVLRQFKPGTPIMSSYGHWIGHVIGYGSFERHYDKWETEGRHIYKLKVIWMNETEPSIVDIADIKLL